MRHLARRIARPVALCALLGVAGCVGAPAPAPVVYTPPGTINPAYAAPGYSQATGYAPPGAAPVQVAYGATCYAGVYTCQLPQGLPLGAPCSCPGLGAPSYGNVR